MPLFFRYQSDFQFLVTKQFLRHSHFLSLPVWPLYNDRYTPTQGLSKLNIQTNRDFSGKTHILSCLSCMFSLRFLRGPCTHTASGKPWTSLLSVGRGLNTFQWAILVKSTRVGRLDSRPNKIILCPWVGSGLITAPETGSRGEGQSVAWNLTSEISIRLILQLGLWRRKSQKA